MYAAWCSILNGEKMIDGFINVYKEQGFTSLDVVAKLRGILKQKKIGNFEPVMNTAEVHTIEHLGATFLRNDEKFRDKVVYFGPMGCRTGFYLILAGDYESKDIVELMISMFEFVRHYQDPVPGANPRECGNYQDMNLAMANYYAEKFLTEVLYNITEDRLVYPEG